MKLRLRLVDLEYVSPMIIYVVVAMDANPDTTHFRSRPAILEFQENDDSEWHAVKVQ